MVVGLSVVEGHSAVGGLVVVVDRGEEAVATMEREEDLEGINKLCILYYEHCNLLYLL